MNKEILKSERLQLSLRPDVKKRFQDWCNKQGISMANCVKYWIVEHLKKESKDNE